jgi:hypothetical protein
LVKSLVNLFFKSLLNSVGFCLFTCNLNETTDFRLDASFSFVETARVDRNVSRLDGFIFFVQRRRKDVCSDNRFSKSVLLRVLHNRCVQNCFVIICLLFVLSLDFVRDNFRHRQGKDARVDSQKKHNPVVSVGTVLDLPLFSLSIPLMTATTGLGDLYVVDRPNSLSFVNVTSTIDAIIKHLLGDTSRKWQLMLVNELLNFFNRNAIIHTVVHSVGQFNDAFHRDLERHVTLP